MKEEHIRFTIDQLRKDKIIYATEAAATSLTCILGLFFANMYLPDPFNSFLSIFILVIGVGYTLYMGVGNALRLNRIRELEKKL